MKTSRVENSISTKALIITPHPKFWDSSVLNAALDSKFIKKAILQNEKAGVDTVMEFESFVGNYINTMFFNLSGTYGTNISLRSNPYPENIIEDESENVVSDLVNKIKSLDDVKDVLTLEEKLQLLKGFAAEVIYK